MTEYNTTTNLGSGEAQGASGAETLDLLIRHLEAAKGIFSSPEETLAQDEGEGEGLAIPDVLCTLLYVVPGTLCPLLYVHVPTVAAESASESA